MSHEPPLVLLGTALVWLGLVALLNPSGAFPMMDDWIYARIVRTWHEEGRLVIPDVTQMLAVGHIAWGVLVTKVAGFHVETLRAATLVVGWGGLLAAYTACRTLGATPRIATLATATVAINPIYLTMSSTFMTDIPFFFWSTLALAGYGRALHTGRTAPIVAATVCAGLATSIRQPGLVLPAAFFVAHLVAHRLNRRSLLQASVPVFLIAIELVLVPRILESTAGLPRDYNLPARELARNISDPTLHWVEYTGKRLLNIGFHVGWFVFPFVAFAAWWTRGRLIACGAFAGAIVAAVLATGKVAPWGSSLLYDFGLGGISLYDIVVLQLPHLPRAPKAFWLALTVCSAVAVAILVVQWGAAAASLSAENRASPLVRSKQAVLSFTALAAAGYVLPLAASWFYDRYLLPVIPCLVAYAVVWGDIPSNTARPRRWLLLLAPYALFAVAAGHDYFAWNRARWAALEFLVQRAPAEQIDGGYEFAGWLRYRDDEGTWRRPADARYLVVFGAVPGYREIARFPYRTWLPFDERTILAVEREQ